METICFHCPQQARCPTGADGLVLVGADHRLEVIEVTRQYDQPHVLKWSVN
ncbi:MULTISPECIES: hypothetical protein [unclassified Caballeronia]|uniref:hypothetical protein n=1 Tax=unclassified Caballeronia TaxID=2646786 RepID=UPI0028639A73|nr:MULTISPECIES: hypothetical protein [unclassified Caballeronia]MDR5741024.1 hypothetical protein [Caballeronia sp. LZ016]MDR5806922.1 hypothetical protein [Caballeronia sp. LZ019]